jgi:hypothetical protein
MKNIKKNRKSWIKGLVVAGVFAISVLNLSVDFRRNANGDINVVTLSSTAAMAQSEESNGPGCVRGTTGHCYMGYYNAYCWTSNYNLECYASY